MRSEINNARDLQNEVSKWVETFNYLQLEVVEKMADGNLFEYIRRPEPDYNEFLNNYQLHDEYKEYLSDNDEEESEESKKAFCEDHTSFERFCDDRENENYPMWNTLFEFKSEESEEVIQAAVKAGFGIIEGLDPFNTMLFVSGAGYSFYSAHWIPMFLELPWNTDIKKQVEKLKIDYQGI